MKTTNHKPDKTSAMERYIEEIDRFAGMLRTQQQTIKELEKEVAIALGLSIERCSTEEARTRPWGHSPACSQHEKPKPQQTALFA